MNKSPPAIRGNFLHHLPAFTLSRGFAHHRLLSFRLSTRSMLTSFQVSKTLHVASLLNTPWPRATTATFASLTPALPATWESRARRLCPHHIIGNALASVTTELLIPKVLSSLAFQGKVFFPLLQPPQPHFLCASEAPFKCRFPQSPLLSLNGCPSSILSSPMA